MQDLIITLLLAGHLLAMNVASAGPLVGASLAGGLASTARLRRELHKLSLLSLCLGSLIGGMLLLWPSEGMAAALRRFPADAFWFAGAELLFSGVCMAGLMAGGDWLAKRRLASLGLAALTATNLLYHFPPLMVVLGELAADPRWTKTQVIERAVLLRLWMRPEILALWAHFTLASFAVTPVAALVRSMRMQAADEPAERRLTRWLGGVALAATALQIPVGLWLVTAIDAGGRSSLMGGDLVASLCFLGGLLGAFWLLQTLVAVTLGEGRAAINRAGYLLLVVTILMTATLRKSRGASRAQQRLAASAVGSNDCGR